MPGEIKENTPQEQANGADVEDFDSIFAEGLAEVAALEAKMAPEIAAHRLAAQQAGERARQHEQRIQQLDTSIAGKTATINQLLKTAGENTKNNQKALADFKKQSSGDDLKKTSPEKRSFFNFGSGPKSR